MKLKVIRRNKKFFFVFIIVVVIVVEVISAPEKVKFAVRKQDNLKLIRSVH